jgi:hypothetical protein
LAADDVTQPRVGHLPIADAVDLDTRWHPVDRRLGNVDAENPRPGTEAGDQLMIGHDVVLVVVVEPAIEVSGGVAELLDLQVGRSREEEIVSWSCFTGKDTSPVAG